MSILVIFTGGTIGSAAQNGWISPDKNSKRLLIEKYREISGDYLTEFTELSPYSILSENLSAHELNTLSGCVLEEIKNGHDGIIVTHGTDTLQYTAAALSFILGKTEKPVLLVSSAYPLDDERANGADNFAAAVAFIKNKPSGGVFVSYKNENEDAVNIHAASRIIAHGEASADVFSIDGEPYAFSKNGKIILNDRFICGKYGKGVGKVCFTDSPDILFIESRPGYGFSFLPEDCCAVIISPYHSGTLNTSSEKFKIFCKKAKEMNIPVFVVNVKGGITYKSSELFGELGLTVLPFCSKISIYVKCWLAQSLNKDISDFVLNPIAQEFLT